MVCCFQVASTGGVLKSKHRGKAMGDPFEQFVSELLDSKAWGDRVDQDGRKQLEEDLKGRLLDQIDRAVIDALPEDQVDGLNELLDREAPDEEVHEYIANSGVDVQGITMQVMLRFRELYLGNEIDR